VRSMAKKLPIAKLGNPVLRQMAAKVDPRDIRTYELQQFIDDLIETMLDEPGIGLAAPQVSRSIQLVVMGCEGEDGFPQTVLINPKIVFYGPQQVENWEGCRPICTFHLEFEAPASIPRRSRRPKAFPLDPALVRPLGCAPC